MGENDTPEERKTAKPGRLSGAVLPIAGLTVVLVGFLIAWINRNTYIGWFAYAPLSNTSFSANGAAFISQGTQIGLGIALVGLLVLAFWAGYRIGKKASPNNR